MDATGVRAAAQTYLDACYESDVGKFREVFNEAAHVYGHIGEGALNDMPIDAFAKFVEAGAPPGYKPDFPRQEEILAIDFTGEDTAVVRLKVRLGEIMFTDILSFIRIGGKWTIIAKLYSGEPA
ncbi:MAG: nuclear transport factor 2 family protein [Oscillospiraceae bacterium]|nr:nuclear transport factor 2 family protein [Oscillospiraceae bacterium]